MWEFRHLKTHTKFQKFVEYTVVIMCLGIVLFTMGLMVMGLIDYAISDIMEMFND
jgi:hypothetical protein